MKKASLHDKGPKIQIIYIYDLFVIHSHFHKEASKLIRLKLHIIKKKTYKGTLMPIYFPSKQMTQMLEKNLQSIFLLFSFTKYSDITNREILLYL